jgi:hypothetical protein
MHARPNQALHARAQVEATKFTEVGFHGRDVDQIIRDLVDAAIVSTRAKLKRQLRAEIGGAVEEKILDSLLGADGPATTRVRARAVHALLRLWRNSMYAAWAGDHAGARVRFARFADATQERTLHGRDRNAWPGRRAGDHAGVRALCTLR